MLDIEVFFVVENGDSLTRVLRRTSVSIAAVWGDRDRLEVDLRHVAIPLRSAWFCCLIDEAPKQRIVGGVRFVFGWIFLRGRGDWGKSQRRNCSQNATRNSVVEKGMPCDEEAKIKSGADHRTCSM